MYRSIYIYTKSFCSVVLGFFFYLFSMVKYKNKKTVPFECKSASSIKSKSTYCTFPLNVTYKISSYRHTHSNPVNKNVAVPNCNQGCCDSWIAVLI